MVAPAIDMADGVYDGAAVSVGMIRENVSALLAATFPVTPPAAWFVDPGFGGPTPLTVEDDGRVYGHIATWAQSHIGMGGKVHAPKSKSNYAFFATGAVKCDDGSFANVGQITLAGGHASIEASPAEAVAHYDNTASAIMDVAVGEDRHGIWVAGGVRPDADDAKLRTLRASSVSGDWRPINGNLELVAVCAVNVPGFPIPRARVASGEPVALIAAGVEPLIRQAILDQTFNGQTVESLTDQAIVSALTPLDLRMRMLEDLLLDRVTDTRTEIDETVLQAKLAMNASVQAEVPELAVDDEAILAAVEQAKRMTALRATVHDETPTEPGQPEGPTPLPAEPPEPEPEPESEPEASVVSLDDLRARVHVEPEIEQVPVDLEELRSRVHIEMDASTEEPDDLEALRARVHVEIAEPVADGEVIDLDALRSWVHGSDLPDAVDDPLPQDLDSDLWEDGFPYEMTTQELVRSSIRGTATSSLNAKKRKTMAKKGQALPDGSYPIADSADLGKAVHAYGRAKNKPRVKRHILKRARALGKTSQLPKDWKG